MLKEAYEQTVTSKIVAEVPNITRTGLKTLFSDVHVRYMLSPVRLSSVSLSVCLSSVTLVHPTQPIVIFGNISTAFGTLARWPYIDIHEKFYGDRPKGTPPSGELNVTGVAKYSDFGPIEGYISETVQDRR